MNEYQIQISANISIGGTYRANTKEEAIEMAKLELRPAGEIVDIDVEQAIYLDPNYREQ